MSRFWALVVATSIALLLFAALVALRWNASAVVPIQYSGDRENVEGLTYEQARLHAKAMHDELCEVWSQDSQRVIDSIHERYGADPADVAFVAGLICPFDR